MTVGKEDYNRNIFWNTFLSNSRNYFYSIKKDKVDLLFPAFFISLSVSPACPNKQI